MDTTKTTTHVGLCAGYGGIELGLKRVIPDLRSVALCEIEAFACANLVAKMEAGFMDPAPIWSDLKTFPWEAFRDRVDILTGGYPCQPFSAAGLRRGKDDPRHLWPWIADGIRAMRPRLCFFENVEGHISMGLSDVIEDLVGMGYRVAWGIFSASEVGAPHQRKRVFILANCNSQRLEGWISGSVQERASERASGAICSWPARPGQPQHKWEPHRVVADTSIDRCDGRTNGISGRIWEPGEVSEDATGYAGEGNGMRQTQSSLGGNPDGPASWIHYAKLCESCDNRTDELRLLGNGVVPATAEKAFRVLFEKLMGRG